MLGLTAAAPQTMRYRGIDMDTLECMRTLC